MRQTREKIILLALLAGVLTAGVTGCGAGGGSNAMKGAPEVAAESAVLTVQPEQTAEVYPKSSGTVTAVYFEVGDTVSEGQVLATLDSDSLNSAQISINSAQLQLETAQKELERSQVLYENDGITQQALETAENSVRSAQLQLESAQDNYNTLLKNISITAPISGVIESKNVDVYDNASMQQAICVISQKSNMEVVFQVSERVKNSLRMGNGVTLEKNGTSYKASIIEIAGKTSDNTGLFEITARIQDGGNLSTGSKVTVSLVTDWAENVLCIPLDAIYYDDGKPYVFVSRDGIVEVVYVETGIYDDASMQIVSDLTQNDQVITSWSSQLTSGALVQSVEDTEKKDNPAKGQLADGAGELDAAESEVAP